MTTTGVSFPVTSLPLNRILGLGGGGSSTRTSPGPSSQGTENTSSGFQCPLHKSTEYLKVPAGGEKRDTVIDPFDPKPVIQGGPCRVANPQPPRSQGSTGTLKSTVIL